MRLRDLAALFILGALGAGGIACTPTTVVRVIDGREVRGRFVSDRAYALYARGAEAEARKDFTNARVHYLAAVEEDEANAEIWTRVGAVACKIGRADEAASAFASAIDHDADYEPAYRERAECALDRGAVSEVQARAALADAAEALRLDPDSEASALLYARAAEAAGDAKTADRALRELVVRSPSRVTAWVALRDFADRRKDAAASLRASIAIASLGASPDPAADGPSKSASAPLTDVDEALARGSLDDARSAAKRSHLPPADLAVRAAALGRGELARAQADLVFKADPTNATAALALATACDLLRDDACLATAFATPSALTTPPAPLAHLLFVELIDRRADHEAARHYLAQLPPIPTGADPLLDTVAARVKKAFAK